MDDPRKPEGGMVEQAKSVRRHTSASEALQDARAYAESIVLTVREPLLVLDAGLKIISANRSFYQVFKVTPEDTDGQFLFDVGNRQWDIPRLREFLEDILPKNNSFDDFEVKHEFPHIGQRIMLLNARRIYQEANKTQLILLAIEDITQRRRAEEALKRRTQELQAANRELEAFAYSVSHDLRAPLRSIDGFSQALLEDYPDKLGDQGKDYLNRVRRAAQRMGQLIDDLLRLSRVTRYEMEHKTVDLSTLAHTITRKLQQVQPNRQVEFTIEEGLTATGDPHLLEIALNNLLDNAWKFSSKKAKAHIEFGSTRQQDKKVFFVRDNGVGFDMTYVDKLFGAFQRLHSSEDYPGTGIGLATVQRIVHRHSGRIWGEGVVNQGATLYFTL